MFLLAPSSYFVVVCFLFSIFFFCGLFLFFSLAQTSPWLASLVLASTPPTSSPTRSKSSRRWAGSVRYHVLTVTQRLCRFTRKTTEKMTTCIIFDYHFCCCPTCRFLSLFYCVAFRFYSTMTTNSTSGSRRPVARSPFNATTLASECLGGRRSFCTWKKTRWIISTRKRSETSSRNTRSSSDTRSHSR